MKAKTKSGKGTKSSTSTRPATANTMQELADAMGVTVHAVKAWTQREEWAPLAKRGPWRVSAVRAWREAHLEEPRGGRRADDGDADDDAGDFPVITPTGNEAVDRAMRTLSPSRQAKFRTEYERGRRLGQANEESAGRLVDRHEIEKAWIGRIIIVRSSLLAIPRQSARDLEMRSAVEIERILADTVERVCNQFAGGETPSAALMPERLRDALAGVKNGRGCWCSSKDGHTAACEAATAALEESAGIVGRG